MGSTGRGRSGDHGDDGNRRPRTGDGLVEGSNRATQTRKALVEAARQAIGEVTFPGLRIDDIVERAGTSHGTFYLYFANKDELLDELLDLARADFESVGAELPDVDGPDAQAEMRSWIRRLVEIVRRHDPILRAHFSSPGRASPTQPLREHMARWVSRQSGDPEMHPMTVAVTLTSAATGIAVLQPDDDMLDTLTRIALLLICGPDALVAPEP